MIQTTSIKELLIELYQMRSDVNEFIQCNASIIRIPEEHMGSSKKYAEELVLTALTTGQTLSDVKYILVRLAAVAEKTHECVNYRHLELNASLTEGSACKWPSGFSFRGVRRAT